MGIVPATLLDDSSGALSIMARIISDRLIIGMLTLLFQVLNVLVVGKRFLGEFQKLGNGWGVEKTSRLHYLSLT